MDPELVVQTLNFHGQQLTKEWESERGAASIQSSSMRDLDYQVFQKRSKDLRYLYSHLYVETSYLLFFNYLLLVFKIVERESECTSS